MNKTKEQMLEEMKKYRETAPLIPDADAQRLADKWADSDDGMTSDVLQKAINQ